MPPAPSPESLTAAQRLVLESYADDIFLLGGGRGSGKTYAMLRWIAQGVQVGNHKWCGLVVLKTWLSVDEAISVLCSMALDMGQGMNTPRVFVSRSVVEFANGAKVCFVKAGQLESVRGWEFNRAAFDLDEDTPWLRSMVRSTRMLSVLDGEQPFKMRPCTTDIIRTLGGPKSATVHHVPLIPGMMWPEMRFLAEAERRGMNHSYMELQKFMAERWV